MNFAELQKVHKGAQLLWKNTHDSLLLGVEDFALGEKDPKRYLSSVRNIFAGILLLFKCRILADDPTGTRLSSKGICFFDDATGALLNKIQGTLNVKEIKAYFDNNSISIELDHDYFNNIYRYRNDIEHAFDQTKIDVSVVKEYVAQSFLLVRSFSAKDLNIPFGMLFLGKYAELVTTIADAFVGEKTECETTFARLPWTDDKQKDVYLNYCCEKCGSNLIDAESNGDLLEFSSFRCKNCGHTWSFNELCKCVSADLGRENYIALKDGDVPPIAYCPSCSHETYYTTENICLYCGEQGPFRCSACDNEIPSEELSVYEDTKMCSWCVHSYEQFMEEDDE